MITRLLVQKPAAYAELDENARIAVSVLQDDGWSVERIDDMCIQLTTTALIAKTDPCAAALAEAELRFAALRGEVIKAGREQWDAAGFAFILSAFLSWCHAGAWIIVLAPPCFGMSAWLARRCRTKGAK